MDSVQKAVDEELLQGIVDLDAPFVPRKEPPMLRHTQEEVDARSEPHPYILEALATTHMHPHQLKPPTTLLVPTTPKDSRSFLWRVQERVQLGTIDGELLVVAEPPGRGFGHVLAHGSTLTG